MIFKKFSLFNKESDASEFLQKHYNDTISELNTGLSRLKLSENFQNQLFKDISIDSGATKTLDHNLRGVPIGRIILKQSGDGVIEDGDYTNKTVELINNSGNDITLTVIFLK